MNCELCQEQLSDYVDGALGGRASALVSEHLSACADCAAAHEELRDIVGAAFASRGHLYAPPDEYALWLRVRSEVAGEGRERRAAAAAHVGFWSRLLTRRWEFTLPQLATATAAVVVAVALVTTLGVQYFSTGQPDAGLSRRARFVEADNYPQTHLQPHQASLKYWQHRVELRKASWNARMRDSFDRSINVLDQSVNESLSDLQRNPHDEVAEQMLNSALRDKIELLREFGEE